MTEFFAKRFPEIALLRRMERGVAQGDVAAIAEVRSWSAAEFIRLETRRSDLVAGLSLVIVIPFLGYFLATFTHRGSLLFLVTFVPLMWLGARRSKLVRYIDDVELINSQFSFHSGDTSEHEARLMQVASASPDFRLTTGAERSLRKKAVQFKSVDDDAWATDQGWKHAIVALLAAKGTELETGKLLESLADTTKYGRLRPTVLREMAAARDRFNSRFYR